ncbi:alpha/beta hydrolase fold domain-containing protein [Kibdelosporangium phytohabitans]|uniref:Esterase n=1 Tax=Kibdelosporangium phytohabitans TaxID=860235 RepID=A0A0N9I1U5_9PSEU|nr:alpha/beta hydrolase fold domain-containing protein [Kibdelosporangium phytohabitans]ALG09622.1 esterase [Kibdelosporangium phytohabitans]MBE1469037.1 acetyl esterase/lipase [Kibdelosporangium phytohabitans]
MSEHPAELRSVNLPSAADAIELKHLRAFVAVADELNFGRAAARLYVSQSALSRQIQALERLIGCPLLLRSTHRVELTLAGEALLGAAGPLLADLNDAITLTRAAGGEVSTRLAQLWNAVLHDGHAGVAQLREAYEALNAQFPVPEATKVRPVQAGGVSALTVSAGTDTLPDFLHLHGGGLIAGSAFGYRPLAGALAAATGATVLLPDYRLAPEHPFPAGLDDAVAAYRWLLDQGADPGKLTVGGDSAGGGLAVSLLLRLEQQGLPRPARAVLLCPSVNVVAAPQDTPVARWLSLYSGAHPRTDPLLSILEADLSGLPPTLVQTGTGDVILHETRRFVDRATEHGANVQLDLYPVSTHVFHLFWSFLPEAADALEQIGRFLGSTDTTAAAEAG